jgi:hypothetical protein
MRKVNTYFATIESLKREVARRDALLERAHAVNDRLTKDLHLMILLACHVTKVPT